MEYITLLVTLAKILVMVRRGNFMRPINTLKHIIDAQQTIPAGTKNAFDLVVGVENAVSTTANQVDIGSKVQSIFLNVQVVVKTNSIGLINNAYFYIVLNPAGLISNATYPDVNKVGISEFRKQIFHQEMAMMSDSSDSIPITLFKGVLKIPRKGGRIGIKDKITVFVGAPTGGPELDACVQCIYKEIR